MSNPVRRAQVCLPLRMRLRVPMCLRLPLRLRLCLPMLLLFVAALPFAAAVSVRADDVDANGQLQNGALQTRFENITKELRCVVCQNESIADSNAGLAGDLRRQVREMLVAGKSDDAIFDYMTARYGEFVRFRPPLEPKTVLIWGAPFIMLLVGAGIIFRIARRRARMPLDDEPAGP